jgi:hypothetical protein
MKTFLTIIVLLTWLIPGLQAQECRVSIKKILVSENAYTKTDEVREYHYNLNNELSCFEVTKEQLQFYPEVRSYFGSITRSDRTQSFLHRGIITVYYFATYEFIGEQQKNGQSKKFKGRVQGDSRLPGMNPVVGKKGTILIR